MRAMISSPMSTGPSLMTWPGPPTMPATPRLFDRRDPDLPPPARGFGPEESGERVRRDLNHAYDRIAEIGQGEAAPGAAFYLKASRDLYTAARRDSRPAVRSVAASLLARPRP